MTENIDKLAEEEMELEYTFKNVLPYSKAQFEKGFIRGYNLGYTAAKDKPVQDGDDLKVKEEIISYYKLCISPKLPPSKEQIIAAMDEYAEYRMKKDKPVGMKWVSVEERLPDDGEEVIGYSPNWVHPDFNTDGTRVCFVNDGWEWISAKWDNDQDSWHTHAKWCCEQGKDFNPTHWMAKPKSPK